MAIDKTDLPLKDMNNEPEVLARFAACKDKCHAYNLLKPSDVAAKNAALKDILGKIGGRLTIQPNFWCDFGTNIEVGDNFFANHGLTILDTAKVTFGNNVFIGPDCGFYTAGHPLDIARRNQGLEYALPITVGDNVWIGGHVTVCPGVTIGEGSVIGAGAVVTQDVPPNSLAVGNPCCVIRKLNTRADKSSHSPCLPRLYLTQSSQRF